MILIGNVAVATVAALVSGPPAPVEPAVVGGRAVVERGALVHADAEALACRAHRRLLKAR